MPGPMIVTQHDESVNRSEVDSIHGAKPEPEERPLTVSETIAKGTGEEASSPGGMILTLDREKMVSVEMDVGERAALVGKHCGNCLFWNHPLGQAKIEQVAFRGTEEERAHLQATFAELTERGGPEAAGEEFVDAGEIFAPTHAEKAMATMGICLKATNLLKEDVLVAHDGHCAGPNIEEIKQDLWSAKDSDTAKRVAAMRDAIFGVAVVKP